MQAGAVFFSAVSRFYASESRMQMVIYILLLGVRRHVARKTVFKPRV